VILGEAHKCEHVGLGRVHQHRQLGDLGPELIGNLAPLQAGHFGVLLGKGGGNEGGDDAAALLAGMGQDIAHLIVTHEVTNVGNDRSQLAGVAKQTKDTLETESLDVVADRGYFNSAEILACEKARITVTLPKPMTSNAKGRWALWQAGLPLRG
jgi:hypothetical protein